MPDQNQNLPDPNRPPQNPPAPPNAVGVAPPFPTIARFHALETSVDGLHTFRQNIGPRLANLEDLHAGQRLGTLEGLGAGTRLTDLETFRDDANLQITALQGSVGQLGPLNGRLDGLQTSVENLETITTAANGRLNNLQGSVAELNAFRGNTNQQLNNIQGSLNALGNAGERLSTLENIQSNVRLQALEGSRDAFNTFQRDANGRLMTLEKLEAGDQLGVLETFRGKANDRLNNLEGVHAGERLSNLEVLNPGERFIELYKFRQDATGRLDTLEKVQAGPRLGELENFRQAAVPALNTAATFRIQANERFGALEADKVNVQDYQKDQAAITGRINAIETMTGNLRDTYKTEIPQLRNRVTGVEKSVKVLGEDITQIQGQIHKNHDELTHRMDKQEKDLLSGIKALQKGQEACCKTVKGMFEKFENNINKKNGRDEMENPSGGNTSGGGAMTPYAQPGSGISVNTIGSFGGIAGNWFQPSFYSGNGLTSGHVPSELPSIISVRPARSTKYVFRPASLSPSPPPSSLSRRHRSPHGYYHRRSHSSNGAYANYNAPSIQIGLQREQGRGLFSKAKKDNVHIAIGGGRGAGGAGGSRRRGSWIEY